MASAGSATAADPLQPWPDAAPWPRSAASWIASAVLHGTLLVAVAMIWTIGGCGTEPGAAIETARTGGIVLKQLTADGERFDTQQSLANSQASSAANNAASDLAGAVPTAGSPLRDAKPYLPGEASTIAGDIQGESGLPTAGGFGDSGGTTGRGGTSGGAARVSVFGVEAEGHKFVYVFDRSTSMQGPLLAAAKAQLIQSLASLGRTHQFQIVFYNQVPSVFEPIGGQGKLVFATDDIKQQAERFVRGVPAAGATKHEAALALAIGMRPDVIFFLTDANFPQLSGDQLRRLQRLNRGAAIHAIEYGDGPSSGEDNFLKALARQNNGSYRYVDTTRLAAGR